MAAVEAQNRDVLLREMQHRVKNNFQLILASIAIQKRRHPPAMFYAHWTTLPAASTQYPWLTTSSRRERRGRSSGSRIIFVRSVSRSNSKPRGIDIDVQADELELSIERAVPLGLILNEVATNSLKHAFGPDAGGRISVKLVAGVGYGEGRSTVSDNGQGITAPNPRGSGLKLIAALARQIGGRVDQESSDRGTTTSLMFPVNEVTKR